MKDYDFEYTKQGTGLILFLVSVAVMTVSIIVLTRLFSSFILADVIFSIALSTVFFLFNRHHIRKSGKASLSDEEVILALSDTKHFDFENLKYYYIYNGKKGIVFTLGFLDGTKFKMGANNNFCDIEPLDHFLVDLKSAIDSYKNQKQADIVQLASIFARKNAVYVLLVLTTLVIAGYILLKMPLKCVPVGFTLPVIFGWIQYFQLKKKNKLVDF